MNNDPSNDAIVNITTNISIYVQLGVALIDVAALTAVNVPEKHMILKDILALETVVQVIETCWYVFVIRRLPQDKMAKSRYYDWSLSTPIMLVNMFCYLLYEDQMEFLPNDTPIRVSSIVNSTQNPLLELFYLI